jgi:hypothetical protein
MMPGSKTEFDVITPFYRNLYIKLKQSASNDVSGPFSERSRHMISYACDLSKIEKVRWRSDVRRDI